jgi:hypothetical protein
MDNGSKIDTVSFGGLGDTVIVNHKIDMLLKKYASVDHYFVESNLQTLKLISEYTNSLNRKNVSFECVFDENYQKNNNWFIGRKRINTTWHGNYHEPTLYDDELSLKNYFKPTFVKKEIGTIVLQVDGGVKSTRNWGIDPRYLALFLRRKYKVLLVGTDKKYKDACDQDNYVCRTSLMEAMQLVNKCEWFVGLSGFFNYVRHYQGDENLYLRESLAHDYHYYSPSSNQASKAVDHYSQIIKILMADK